MARTEALKQAQRRYRLKIQSGDDYKQKEAKRHRERYIHNRNYTQKGNWAVSFKWLYA